MPTKFSNPRVQRMKRGRKARRARKTTARPKRKDMKRSSIKRKVAIRAPIVETKKRTLGVLSGFVNPANVFSSFPCRSFLNQAQGLDEDQMIGTTIFSKYYSMKVKLNFPTDHPIEDNFRAMLVWGWVTAPLAYPNQAPTGAPAGTPIRGTVGIGEMNNEIVARTADGFNQNVDQMTFRDKEKTLYKVVGKKWVEPDRRHQIGVPQSATAYIDPDDDKLKIENTGSLPPWTHQITFKPMRKVKYTYSNGNSEGSIAHWYPNESWVPWVALYTPNIGSYYEDGGVVPDGAKITFSTNDCHWYTDS